MARSKSDDKDKLTKKEKEILALFSKYGIDLPRIREMNGSLGSYRQIDPHTDGSLFNYLKFILNGTRWADPDPTITLSENRATGIRDMLDSASPEMKKLYESSRPLIEKNKDRSEFILAHELGHYIQDSDHFDSALDRRKALDRYNSEAGGNQYDLRDIHRLTGGGPSISINSIGKYINSSYKSGPHQREADVIGQAILDEMDNKDSEYPYIDAYRSYIKNSGSMNNKRYGFGGFLKKALPIAGKAAAFIPGVGTAASAAIGVGTQLAAGMIGGEGEQESIPRMPLTESRYSYANGGFMKRYAKGGFTEFSGPRHEAGGIKLGNGEEVEGGETMDFIVGKNGNVKKNQRPYVFSDRLKVPGSNLTFAKKHKQLVKRGASEDDIRMLAAQQERSSGRGNPNNTGIPSGNKKFLGGFLKDNALEISSILPDVMNFATGALAKDKTRPATRIDTSAADNINTTYNINPLLSRNSAGYRAILSDPNANAATKLAAQGQKLGADSSAYADKANIEGQLQSRKAGISAQLALGQGRMDEQFRQDKMQSEANLGLSGNFARSALTNMSSKVTQFLMDKNNTAADRDNMRMTIAAIGKGDPAFTNRLLELFGFEPMDLEGAGAESRTGRGYNMDPMNLGIE